MNMNWLQSLIYGIVSGLTEFAPISSAAHQNLLLSLFGTTERDPVRDMLIHLSMVFALVYSCRGLFAQYRIDKRGASHKRVLRRNAKNLMDIQFVRGATFPMLLGMIVLSYIFSINSSLLATALFLLLNGIVLFVSERMLQGNKGAGSMSALDSWLVGVAGSLSVFPGVSRLGTITSVSRMRGADRIKALNWALILSVPALITVIVLDVFSIIRFTGTINFWSSLIGYILSVIGAVIGVYSGTRLIKYLTRQLNFACFAYYSWGAALFSFLLYLTVV